MSEVARQAFPTVEAPPTPDIHEKEITWSTLDPPMAAFGIKRRCSDRPQSRGCRHSLPVRASPNAAETARPPYPQEQKSMCVALGQEGTPPGSLVLQRTPPAS